jgi:hypothetical protein
MYAYYPEFNYSDIYTLTTYYHLRNKKEIPKYCYSDNLILDSGAFTFFGGKKVDWNIYVDNYIDFINKCNKKLFFELDIDSIVGLSQVEDIRKRIINKTGKNPIPVWHPSRGIDYYKRMVDEFDYIALSLSGQYTSAWIKNPNADKVIYKLLSLANKNNCKVHGLGYTKLSKLGKFNFYSVDSTSWIMSMKFGNIKIFNGKGMEGVKRPDNTKMINPKLRLKQGFDEWVKFQKYAEGNL